MAARIEPEKRDEIIRYLSNPLMTSNTNESIARLVGCDEGTVRRIRNKLDLGEPLMESNRKVIERIPLDRIIMDKEIQPRESIDADVVNEYKDFFRGESAFPPIIVVKTEDGYIVADGFHRTVAAQKAKQDTILAEIREGDRLDAMFIAAGANTTHGKQRTKGDKTRAVKMLLGLDRCKGWTQKEVADYVKVSQPLVNKILSEDPTYHSDKLGNKSTGKDGRSRPTRYLKSPGTNGPPQTPQGPSPATPADPVDSLASNPDDGGEPSFEPDQIEGQTDGETVASTPPQPERKPPEVRVEDVKSDPVAERPKVDPEIQFLESCPLFRGLSRKEWKRSGRTPVEWFTQSARRYYRGRERKKAYFDFHKANLCGGKDAGNCLDPLASEDHWWLKISHPRHWHDCLGDETGQCHRDCRTCKGFGFMISRED